jgi:hypothetical protein
MTILQVKDSNKDLLTMPFLHRSASWLVSCSTSSHVRSMSAFFAGFWIDSATRRPSATIPRTACSPASNFLSQALYKNWGKKVRLIDLLIERSIID